MKLSKQSLLCAIQYTEEVHVVNSWRAWSRPPEGLG